MCLHLNVPWRINLRNTANNAVLCDGNYIVNHELIFFPLKIGSTHGKDDTSTCTIFMHDCWIVGHFRIL